MNLNLFKSYSLFDRLFHLFLLSVGISIGIISALSLKSFFLPINQTPPPPPLEPPPPHAPPPPPPPPLAVALPPPAPQNNMRDDELLWRASTVSANIQEFGDGKRVILVPRVAFMFLTPGPLPLAPLWDVFFRGYQGKYSIYVYAHPSYNESAPQDSVFHGTRIPSQPVQWGTISMIDAERRLIANALLDPSNQRFVLLSDSCIPLYNFSTIYDYLISSSHSFLASVDDPRKPGRGRYNRQMWPTITIQQWRKGSQWFELHRELALKLVSDQKYHKVFQDFCLPPCYNDEHYFPTLVNILDLEMMNANRSITRVDWSRGGPHPRRFGWVDVRIELLHWLRFDSECMYNGHTTNVCYLFARKFLPNTLGPLLKIAPSVLGFDP
ncbi:glycosyltransferase BC10 [Primulina huaijiensis]|uniref:glycosyltransferase BC10 n=1 Tax=Primulina huaijiensis TaxID=1492673 RepID=UPI003CC76BC2